MKKCSLQVIRNWFCQILENEKDNQNEVKRERKKLKDEWTCKNGTRNRSNMLGRSANC